MNDNTSKQIVPSNPDKFQLFNFQDSPVRILTNEDGEPLFVASDVCKAMEIANVGNVLARLDEDEKDIRQMDTPGGVQNMAVVTEPGLYTIILRSDKPTAKEFKRWITHEVIPAIRKTGGYAIQNASPLQLACHMLEAMEHQQAQLDDHAERITSLEAYVQVEPEYFTVMGYFRKRGLHPPTLNEAQSIGQKAARLSRSKGYGIGKTSDPRFGEVNTYNVAILNEVVES